MRKLFLFAALFLGMVVSAQEVHFTIYNFDVAPEDRGTVYSLCDEYFSQNKPEGVMVSLWENHFKDRSNNFSHGIVFSGSVDALGAMYSGDNDDTWNYFITRLNQHVEDGFSSAMGTRMVAYGDTEQPHPYQRYYILDVDEMSKFRDSYDNMMKNNNPDGRLNMMGNYSVGHGPDGANAWVINGFKDFKTAIGGVGMLRTDAQKDAASKAWDKHREERGDVKLVRSGMRILMKSW